MLKIASITGENFKSFKKFDFTIEEGLWVIRGDNKDDLLSSSNGAGKTTLFCDSIYWCLTGKSIEGLESADDIVNLKTKKDCFVEVTLFADDKKVKIKRTRKHTLYKNNLFLEVNDQDLTAHRVDDTQVRVNQIIKISSEILKSTIIMSSDIKSRFSDLTPKDRISLLESIRDYKVWDRFRDETKVSLDDYNKKIEHINSDSLKKSGEVSALTQVLQTQNLSLEQLKLNEVDDSEIENKEKVLAEFKSKPLNKDTITGLKTMQTEIQTKLQDIENQNKKILVESNATYSRKSSVDFKLKQHEKDIQTNVALLDDNGICPTCGQRLQLSEEKKQNIFSKLSDLKQKYIILLSEQKELEIKIQQSSQVVAQDTSELRSKVQSINEQIIQLEREDMNTAIRINSLQSEITTLKDKSNSYLQRIGELQKSIEDYELKLDDLNQQINLNKDSISSLESEKSSFQFFYDSLGPRGTLRPYLLSRDIAYLNRCLQYYSSRMYGNAKISLTKPTIDSNKIDIIFECDGLVKPVSILSRGERKRLDLCIQFSLYDLVKSTAMFDINLLILDEIFESLDVTGIAQVVSILQERSENIPSIYVISHNPNAYDLISKQIVVTKSNDTSKVIKYTKARSEEIAEKHAITD